MRGSAIALCALALIVTTCAGWCASVAVVKATAQNWMQVTVEGIITYTEPSECYIESPDRSGGIWVQAPMDGFGVGDPVLAVGTFAVVDGEPAVTKAAIFPHGARSEIRPFGMSNLAVGGASKWSPMFIWDYGRRRIRSAGGWTWQRDWSPTSGANNTGLLVTTCGMVRSICYSPITGASWFFVDDGSGVVSDYGDTGLLVYGDTPANIGDFVSVTGVSSTERSFDDPSRLIRVIRTRGAEDVNVVRSREAPVYPFSDEFDGPTLDPRWTVIPGQGQVSVEAVPGWLVITGPSSTYGTASISLVQPESGDWDLETKLRLERVRNDISSCWASVSVELGVRPEYNGIYSDTVLLAGLASDWYSAQLSARTLGGVSVSCTGDTCWFRARRRGSTVYGQVSLDGIDYTAERQVEFGPNSFLRIRISDSDWLATRHAWRGLIDYIRFATVAE